MSTLSVGDSSSRGTATGLRLPTTELRSAPSRRMANAYSSPAQADPEPLHQQEQQDVGFGGGRQAGGEHAGQDQEGHHGEGRQAQQPDRSDRVELHLLQADGVEGPQPAGDEEDADADQYVRVQRDDVVPDERDHAHGDQREPGCLRPPARAPADDDHERADEERDHSGDERADERRRGQGAAVHRGEEERDPRAQMILAAVAGRTAAMRWRRHHNAGAYGSVKQSRIHPAPA
ncbi:hypothetical protein ACFWBF_35135 [Streptomyces sp. NPDC060028]|uniref:hypothetical protein n=1 Tax=Streptomyces sp. NPDC060028 TaxID=3347041 RepID=UPI0036AC69E7